MGLSTEQLAFFKNNGYLLVKGAMPIEHCDRARDLLWQSLPRPNHLDRDDIRTHRGPFTAAERSTDATHVRDGFRWQVRDLGTHPDVINLIYSDVIVAMAESLLGAGTLRQHKVDGVPMGSHGPAWPGGPVDPALGTEGARGIYCTLAPETEPAPDAKPKLGCHTDGHPFHLGVVGLLADSPPHGGAFTIWPGSHRRLYPTFALQYDQPRIPYYDHLPSFKGIVHTPAYLEEIARVQRDIKPLECHGEAGDIVFWHHRLAHAAGDNQTPIMREAILADFWKLDLDECRASPPHDDMWHDWSAELRDVDVSYTADFATTQRLV